MAGQHTPSLLACKVGNWLYLRKGLTLTNAVVISHVRLWVMYRSRKVLFVMTGVVTLALAAMGVIEGFGYTGVTGTASP